MSNDIRNWAKTVKVGDRNAKQIFLEIADCADDLGFCDRDGKWFERVLEMSEKTVERGLSFLVEKNLIRRETAKRTHGQFPPKITQMLFSEDDRAEIARRRSERENRNHPSPSVILTDGESEPTAKTTDGDSHRPSICPSPSVKMTYGQNDGLIHRDLGIDTSEENKEEENTKPRARAPEAPPANLALIKPPERRTCQPAANFLSYMPDSVEEYRGVLIAGLKTALGIKTFAKQTQSEWEEAGDWAFENDYSPDDFLECHALLDRQKWRTSRISPKTVVENLPNLAKLKELEDAENNGTHQFNSREKREQSAIGEHLAFEQLRAANAERQRFLQERRSADSG